MIGPLRQRKTGSTLGFATMPPADREKNTKEDPEAGADKKDRERLYHDFRHSLTDGRLITRENATFADALDRYAQFQAAQMRLGFVDDKGKARWTMHEMRHHAGSMWLALGMRIEDVSRMLGHAKIETTQKYYIHQIRKLNLERDRPFMVKVSQLHRALPKPMRDPCEIDGEAIEIK